jgi:transcription initiation factor TFIIIB Brf1 subunit/transcription initiation factor TFIIB
MNSRSYNTLSLKMIEVEFVNECLTSTCRHLNGWQEEDGFQVCIDCGIECTTFSHDPEWRYYGDNEADPVRCHIAKPSCLKGIDKVLESAQLSIPDSIKSCAEGKYRIVVGNKTVRGNHRKAIVAVCILHAYREHGDMRTVDDIRAMFKLSKKLMSAGQNEYSAAFPADRTKTITPTDLVARVVTMVGISVKHTRHITDLTTYVSELTSQRLTTLSAEKREAKLSLKRSTPQAITAAVVFYYGKQHPDCYDRIPTKTKFAENVRLSDITVTKLARAVETLLAEEVERKETTT